MVDLADVLQTGDVVAWPQGAGEPLTLTRQLVDRRDRLPDVTLFFGTLLGDTLTPENATGLRLTAMGGLGSGSALTKADLVDIMPIRVTAIPAMITSGRFPVDVALIQVAGPDALGRYSVGCTSDYVREIIHAARVVVAEVNAQAPFTLGDTIVDASDFDLRVDVSYPPLEIAGRQADPGSPVAELSRRIAELIPDGATLQTGIGQMVDTLPLYLEDKNDLGIHSGVIGDSLLRLIRRGVITNRAKEIDEGQSVTGALFGTSDLYAWADRNQALSMRGLSYTHSRRVLSELANFWSVNGAIEVDLSGQINSEVAGSKHTGAVGGQLDFANAAMASTSGRSIVGLPSTAGRGQISRICTNLTSGVVSTARADADLIVTEYGVADLRGASLSSRAERLIAIAHPDHRTQLQEEYARSRNGQGKV